MGRSRREASLSEGFGTGHWNCCLRYSFFMRSKEFFRRCNRQETKDGEANRISHESANESLIWRRDGRMTALCIILDVEINGRMMFITVLVTKIVPLLGKILFHYCLMWMSRLLVLRFGLLESLQFLVSECEVSAGVDIPCFFVYTMLRKAEQANRSHTSQRKSEHSKSPHKTCAEERMNESTL